MLGYDSQLFALPETLTSFVPDERLQAIAPLMQAPLPESYYLHAVAVHAGYRRYGLARQLLETSLMLAKTLGYRMASLHAWADNTAALRLYETVGFDESALITMPQAHAMGHVSGQWLLTQMLDATAS